MKFRNKILSFVLALCLIIPCALVFTACDKDKDPKAKVDAWDGSTVTVSEAVENVITIETAEELAGLAKSVNEGNTYEGVTIKLTSDLNLKNKEWKPIGYGSSSGYGLMDADSKAFKGVFDGQDHTIYNLKITTFVGGGIGSNEAASGIGLFGHTYGATIKNLDVEKATVTGNHFVGTIVGFAIGTTIEDVDVEDVAISCVYLNADESGDKAGAIVGWLGNNSTDSASMIDCSAEDSTVNAARDAGQVIGCMVSGTYSSNTTTTQSDNSAENVVVTDNNETQNTANNDNIKNEIVGRVV